ncbi:recombinase family protein [Bryobacter aggregatus]|uniref:recombinase family protein n=1 Tax=Bryobacter aggregatus TaxID=360054 RepID=UPI0004E285FA|nr:recombinase family protein [Bryobacter aggregatus]
MAKRFQGNRALCYVRVSTVEQSKFGFSLDAQEDRLRAYCQMAGLEVMELVREEGVSASIPLAKRPAGAKLLEWMNNGVGHVVCLKLDRLFRDAEDALRQTKAWDKAGVSLHLVDMGGQSLSTGSAMGRMFLTLMAGCAELERNLVAERTASVLAHKKQQGKVYNHTPFGFERAGDRLVVAAAEMAMVRLMHERREDGWSLAMIADAFNADHIPGKNGGKWYGRTVKNILENSLFQMVAGNEAS